MIKCEVIKDFKLKNYEYLKNIQRKAIDIKGKFFVGDKFECDKKMADYLAGKNESGDIVIKIIEIKPKKKASKK